MRSSTGDHAKMCALSLIYGQALHYCRASESLDYDSASPLAYARGSVLKFCSGAHARFSAEFAHCASELVPSF
jgi:hypothetical protein